MKAAPFTYERPRSIADAVAALARHGDDAKVLAGGQSLVPMMNLRLARPACLIDIGTIPELAGISANDDGLSIGALTTHRDVESSDIVATRYPVLAEAVRWIAHPPIRARGTVGGSVAHADPAAELPALMLLLEAEVIAVSARGQRRIAASDLFLGHFTTSLASDEVLTEIRLPAREHEGWAFLETARRHGDFALVGVAALLSRSGAYRIALFGVSAVPVLATGEAGSVASWNDIASHVTAALEPPSDLHASSTYRRHVAAVLVARALEAAHGRLG